MTDEGCTGEGRGTGQVHTCGSCTPRLMTDMEIPQALVEDAVDVFLAARYPDAGIYTANKTRPNSPAVGMRAALEFALPHLLTEAKSMCETAAAVGLALGRKEALGQAEAAIREKLGVTSRALRVIRDLEA